MERPVFIGRGDMKNFQREITLTNAAENFVLDIVVAVIVIFTIIAAIAFL